MGYGWDILAPVNVTRVMQETQDRLTLPMPLLWDGRAHEVNATDEELTMREKNYVFAADIIAADSRALIRDAGQFDFVQHSAVQMKHGFAISGSMIKLYRRIEKFGKGGVGENEVTNFEGYIARKAKELLTGIRQRKEAILNGMFLDTYSYDKLGIKINGTFGMPVDLKFVPIADWDDATNAKPVTDIINILMHALRKYGEAYNRITMSYQALTYIVASAEFKNIYKDTAFSYMPGSNATVEARAQNPSFYVSFLANFIGAGVSTGSQQSRQIIIEIDEGQYREASAASTIAGTTPFHPAAEVYFSNTADDNSPGGWDWANGEVMEAVLGRLGGTAVIGSGFPESDYGPLGYATQADVRLNPPGMVLWAVAGGGPRKHRDTCTAKLTAWT